MLVAVDIEPGECSDFEANAHRMNVNSFFRQDRLC